MGFFIPIIIPLYNFLFMSDCKTCPKKPIKNIVNGYLKWKKMLPLLINLKVCLPLSSDSLFENNALHPQKHLTKKLLLNLLMPKSKLKDSRTNWMMHLVPKTWSYD